MLPVVIRTTDEMLALVPRELREAAYALGGRKAGTIIRGRAARGGARHRQRRAARGRPGRGRDRAAALHDRLSSTSTNTDLFNGPNTALSVQIFRNANQVFPGPQDRAWGAALTLIVIVFVFTILARLVTAVLRPKARRHELDDDREPSTHCSIVPTNVAPDDRTRPTRRPRPSPAEVVLRARATRPVDYSSAPRRRRRRPRHRGQRDHRVHRTVGLRQDHVPALPQPDERLHPRREGRRPDHVPRRGPLRRRRSTRPRCGAGSAWCSRSPNPFPKSIFDNVAYGPRINGQGRPRRPRRAARSPAPRCGTR